MIQSNRHFRGIVFIALMLVISVPHGLADEISDIEIDYFEIQLISNISHDSGAFTQGLLIHDGRMFESTGLTDNSSLREVNLTTGEIIRSVPLPESDFFGEGLTLVEDKLIQLTWKNNIAYVWNLSTFDIEGNFSYSGEGWGICYDEVNKRLIMSDGSSTLWFRDPDDFHVIGQIDVTRNGSPQKNINELECVNGDIYANVWTEDIILLINTFSGNVIGEIDASNLLSEEERMGADVLNGIAYDADSETFYITGKRWPKMYQVEFIILENHNFDNSTQDDECDSDSSQAVDARCEEKESLIVILIYSSIAIMGLSLLGVGMLKVRGEMEMQGRDEIRNKEDDPIE